MNVFWVVIVDDILSNGHTAAALVEMVREAGTEVFAAAFIMEKHFKRGREILEALDVPVATLAQVLSATPEHVEVAGA